MNFAPCHFCSYAGKNEKDSDERTARRKERTGQRGQDGEERADKKGRTVSKGRREKYGVKNTARKIMKCERIALARKDS